MAHVGPIEKAGEIQPADADQWDEQIEQDGAAGRLDALAAEALEDFRAGSVREL